MKRWYFRYWMFLSDKCNSSNFKSEKPRRVQRTPGNVLGLFYLCYSNMVILLCVDDCLDICIYASVLLWLVIPAESDVSSWWNRCEQSEGTSSYHRNPSQQFKFYWNRTADVRGKSFTESLFQPGKSWNLFILGSLKIMNENENDYWAKNRVRLFLK